MRFDEAYSGKVFIASRPEWEEADAILYGMPMDWTVSYRPGSRFGPSRIREVSIGLEEYSPYLDRDLADLNFFDAGDIPLPFGNPQRSLDMIEEYVDSILEKGKFPMGMGESTSCHGLSLKRCTRNTQTLRLSILTHIQIFVLIMRENRFLTPRRSVRRQN